MTTKTWHNRTVFQVPDIAEVLVGCLFKYRDRGAYLLHEFVVLPHHLHLLLTPSTETTLEKAMQLIKGGSSHEIHRVRGHRMIIWQPGFHDWTVRSEADYRAKAEYIPRNLADDCLARRAADWPYCSSSGKYTMDDMPKNLSASEAKAHSA